jgi:hypothetical protein
MGTPGQNAATGMSATCATGCDPNTCDTTGTMTLNGGSTTAGTMGAPGGSGGGGSGGPTYLYVTVNGAMVTSSLAGQWQTPTVGANGGTPNGPNGPYGAHLP